MIIHFWVQPSQRAYTDDGFKERMVVNMKARPSQNQVEGHSQRTWWGCFTEDGFRFPLSASMYVQHSASYRSMTGLVTSLRHSNILERLPPKIWYRNIPARVFWLVHNMWISYAGSKCPDKFGLTNGVPELDVSWDMKLLKWWSRSKALKVKTSGRRVRVLVLSEYWPYWWNR